MLERLRVCSTFFVLGECAEVCPEIIEEIYDKGHEIASHGYVHRDFTKMSLHELVKVEIRNRQLLKKITGEQPRGFRAPLFKVDSKVISTIEKVGYEYDSSVVPSINIPGWFGHFNAPLYPHRIGLRRDFFEVPVAVFPYLRLPAGGGWFVRNFGLRYVETAIRLLLRKKLPAIIYIHPLDVYSRVPRLAGIPFHITRRCGEYTLKAMEHILKKFDCKRMAIKDLLSMWKEQT
jgi:peptidoglycan/xylan/chitin deacetylase (PgdA/CDA1 family)